MQDRPYIYKGFCIFMTKKIVMIKKMIKGDHKDSDHSDLNMSVIMIMNWISVIIWTIPMMISMISELTLII